MKLRQNITAATLLLAIGAMTLFATGCAANKSLTRDQDAWELPGDDDPSIGSLSQAHHDESYNDMLYSQ